MRKRILAFALPFLLVAALIGCSASAKERETAGHLNALKDTCPEVTNLPCLTKAVTSIIVSQSLDEGFRVVHALYLSEPSFRPLCHPLALRVGEATADSLSSYKTLSYTSESAVCNYGFYQSYPTTLLIHGTPAQEVRDFCEYAAKTIISSVPDIRAECFRGIGRGLPFSDKSLYGDPQAMANLGVRTCKEMAPGKNEYDDCISGVFNKLGREMADGNYGLSVRADDPLWLCREQPADIRPRCYGNLKNASLGLIFGNENPQQMLDRVERVYGSSSTGTEELLNSAGYEKARVSMADANLGAQEVSFRFCEGVPTPFDRSCARGYAVGLAKHGTPWKQHLQVIKFCKQASVAIPGLTTGECVRDALFYLRGFYSPAQGASMCPDMQRELGVSCE